MAEFASSTEVEVASSARREEEPKGRHALTRFGFREAGPLFMEPEVPPRTVLALRIVNVAAFVCVCVVNGLGASGIIAGRSQGDVSDANPTPITPSGYAFSIWGLIYFFQAVLFLVYSFLPAVNHGLIFRRIAFWHLCLCVLNCLWIVAFSFEQLWLSSVILWLTLLTLLVIYTRIHTHRGLSVSSLRSSRTWMEYLCVYVPWSLYTSWVLGASLIGIFIPLERLREEMVYGGVIALAFAAFANIAVLAWTRDVVFAAVNVWTLVAIAKAQSDLPVILGASSALAGAVGACAVAVWILNVLEMFDINLNMSLQGHRQRQASNMRINEPMLPSHAII